MNCEFKVLGKDSQENVLTSLSKVLAFLCLSLQMNKSFCF